MEIGRSDFIKIDHRTENCKWCTATCHLHVFLESEVIANVWLISFELSEG